MERERRKFEVAVTFTVLFATVMFLSVGCASAETIYVPDNFTTIQGAVDKATANDIIIVRDGTYNENVDVAWNMSHLTIRSENGSVSTTVQASNPEDPVFHIQGGDYVNISGFTVTGATYGAGIYLGYLHFQESYSSHCNISDNIVSNNYYGIFLDYSYSNTVLSNTVNGNEKYGIYLNYSSNNRIYNNYFNNTNNAYDYYDYYDEYANAWNITKEEGTNILGGPYLGGNYWSDYAGEDTNGDGLGNTSLPYNSGGNITNDGDWLPLTPLQDLSISPADLHFDPLYPLAGNTVNITTTVHNTGSANATNVTVGFYVNGDDLTETKIIQIIPALETRNASISWTAAEEVGSYEILVKIDENNLIEELNEENNQAEKSIIVTPEIPPLTISLIAYPELIEATGSDNTTIIAIVTDESGRRVNGTEVTFSTSLGNFTSTNTTTTSNITANGIATATLRSSISAGTAAVTGSTTVNDTLLEDTVHVVFNKTTVVKTDETITNVTIRVGDATVTDTSVTIRDGIIIINTSTVEDATIIAGNATKGSMIPIAIQNGTLEVTLSANASSENKTVTDTISSIKLNTTELSYITSKPEVGTAKTDLDVNFTGIFTPANLTLALTLRDDIAYVADFVSADATTIENNILANFSLEPTVKNRSNIVNNTAILVYANLSGTHVEKNVTGVPINITVNKEWFDNVAGGNPKNVKVFKISDTGKVEKVMTPEKADPINNRITFCTTFDRFSVFVLIAQPAVPSTGDSDGGYRGAGSGGPTKLIANQGINIFKFDWLDLDITELLIDLKSMEINAQVTLKKIDKPAEVTVPRGIVYDYFEITSNIKSENIRSAAVKFRVSKSWCETNDISVATIKMCRYANTKGWKELETEKIKEDDDHFYFSAETSEPGLSVFVISGEKKLVTPTPSPTPTPTPAEPSTHSPTPAPAPVVQWFIIMAAIFVSTVIVAVFFYWYQRK